MLQPSAPQGGGRPSRLTQAAPGPPTAWAGSVSVTSTSSCMPLLAMARPELPTAHRSRLREALGATLRPQQGQLPADRTPWAWRGPWEHAGDQRWRLSSLGFRRAGGRPALPCPLRSQPESQEVRRAPGRRWRRVPVSTIFMKRSRAARRLRLRPRQRSAALCGEQDGNWGSSNLLTICKRLHTSHVLSSPHLTLMSTALSVCIISGRGRGDNF